MGISVAEIIMSGSGAQSRGDEVPWKSSSSGSSRTDCAGSRQDRAKPDFYGSPQAHGLVRTGDRCPLCLNTLFVQFSLVCQSSQLHNQSLSRCPPKIGQGAILTFQMCVSLFRLDKLKDIREGGCLFVNPGKFWAIMIRKCGWGIININVHYLNHLNR